MHLKIHEVFSGFARGALRAIAAMSIILAYGLGQLGVIGFSGFAVTAASTTPAHAFWWRGRGRWGSRWTEGRRGGYRWSEDSRRGRRR